LTTGTRAFGFSDSGPRLDIGQLFKLDFDGSNIGCYRFCKNITL
jgi:hypothetical protein